MEDKKYHTHDNEGHAMENNLCSFPCHDLHAMYEP